MTQTADRYGKVLYDLRVPAEDVEQMKAALCAAPQLVKILNDPTLTKEVKHEIIETIFPKSLHNFLKTVSDRRRCDQIDDMLESYRACVRKERELWPLRCTVSMSRMRIRKLRWNSSSGEPMASMAWK